MEGYRFRERTAWESPRVTSTNRWYQTSGVHVLIFAKLKALRRKAAARTYDDLWKAVGAVCDLFTEDECPNYFIAAGCKPE